MKRSRMIVLGLTAVFALVAVGFVLVQQLSVTSASATPEMKLTVSDPPGVCAGEKCTLDTGASFKLSVEIVKAPAAGYITSQSYVDYGSDLIYTKKAAIADEVLHPDCGLLLLGAQFPDGNMLEGQRSHSCSSGAFPIPATSTYAGPFIELQMTCSAGVSSTVVELIPLADPIAAGSGAGFVEADGVTQTPTSDTLTINCGAGAAETETPTPTGPTATATLTGTPGPATDTPTPAPPTNTPPPPPPTATPTDVIPGDVDCDGVVSSLDALLLLQLVAQLVDELPCPDAADVNEDGMVDPVDALWILWIEAGLV